MDIRPHLPANQDYWDPSLAFCRRWALPLAVLSILVTLSLLWAIPAIADTLEGRVVGVADGDTITVLDLSHKQHKVRLASIDAPEKKQAYGQRAKQRMSYLVYGKPVLVDYSKRDRYGRIVGKVWVAPGDACPSAAPECPKTLDAGLSMLTVGLAWHYKQYEKEQIEADRQKYAYWETAARERRLGLWADAAPTPPWEFRAAQRGARQ